MSENLERKSADFVLSLIKVLCIFRPDPRQNFFIAPPGPRSIITRNVYYVVKIAGVLAGETDMSLVSKCNCALQDAGLIEIV